MADIDSQGLPAAQAAWGSVAPGYGGNGSGLAPWCSGPRLPNNIRNVVCPAAEESRSTSRARVMAALNLLSIISM